AGGETAAGWSADWRRSSRKALFAYVGTFLASSDAKSMKLSLARPLSLGFANEIRLSTRHQQPVIEIEHDRRVIFAVTAFAGPGIARAILGGGGAHAQRTDVIARRQRRRLHHFGPGIDRVAAEGRADMAAGIDRGEAKAIGEAIEGQRTGERHHMAAI